MTTKLQFYYLELPRFQKGWEAAQTNAERWCYLFRNLYKFAGVPRDASDFEPIFEIARTEQFEEEQLKVYLNAMVTDYEKLVIGEFHEQKGFNEGRERGRQEGREEGREEGKKEERLAISRRMLLRGESIETICADINLTAEEIKALQ